MMRVKNAYSQASEHGHDFVVHVAVFGPSFGLISDIGSILAKNRPTAVDSA